MTRRILLAVGLMALTACGTDGGSGTAATDAPSTSTAPKQATTRQIASIVAEQDQPLRAAYTKARPCTFYDEPRCDLVAQLNLQTFATLASTLRLGLDAADDDRPNNGLYVGAYPTEIEALVASTLNVLGAIDTAGKDYQAQGCPASKAPICGQRAVEILLVQGGSLIGKLDAWRPYL